MLYLNVPYYEKDQAKALGARWDPRRRQWYVPFEGDPSRFRQWILEKPEPASGPEATLIAPVFMITSETFCDHCGGIAPVIALAASGVERHETGTRIDRFVVACWITWLSPSLVAALAERASSFFLDWTSSGSCYYLNHCSCGAGLDDFDLHEEPDGAFFPMEAEACGGMRLITLPAMADLTVAGSWTQSNFDWQRHVPRA
jgi:hypothetical protein